MLFTQIGGHAAPPTVVNDPLKFTTGLLVTGNYVEGFIDLTEQDNPIDMNGFSTGTINISGVPPEADIIAAYLYWETITLETDPNQAAGVTFRDTPIDIDDAVNVKKTSIPLVNNTASCWSAGVPLRMWFFRADVLSFLPVRLDKDDKPTVKRLVNNADLQAHGKPLHEVKLPARQGNQLPESPGASIVIVYQDPSEPLRKIVFYDGQAYVQDSLTETTAQTLRGFYKSAQLANPNTNFSAKITHIMGSGQPNGNERVLFNGTNNAAVVSPPDPITGGSSSQRGWSNLTYDVGNRMPGGNSNGYGEQATTRVDHTSGGGYDCLSWGAIVFSTVVADADPNGDPNIQNGPIGDGIPDGLEAPAANGALKDPDDRVLPNLVGMGATSSQRDLFVEFNALWAPGADPNQIPPFPGTQYGSPSAPYSSTQVTVTDALGHHHVPTPEVLTMIGDRFAAHGIKAHFDVGKPGSINEPGTYHALGVIQHADWVDDYTLPVGQNPNDKYLVSAAFARGRELIEEKACDPTSPTCEFPAYPGAIGWKLGFEIARDAQVGDDGEELTISQLTDPNDPNFFNWSAGTQRRRFDLNRRGLFHYVLNGHFRAKRKSPFPCLTGGVPTGYPPNSTTCSEAPNPEYITPSSSSGIADIPGDGSMVTLGRWEEFVGRPYIRAATIFHELGHNFELWHGGAPAVWGNKFPTATATSTVIEPNCKPYDHSTRSYLHQVHGLFDDQDNIYIDFSGTTRATIDENNLLDDGPLSPAVPPMPTYRPAWYAPFPSALAADLGITSKATRFCSGAKFDLTLPEPSMARVYTETIAESIDWDGDLSTGPDTSASLQDINFDGVVNADSATTNAQHGYNDWANLRLNQMGAGRKFTVFASGDPPVVLLDFGSGDTTPNPLLDFGSGDDGTTNPLLDFGSGGDPPSPLLDFGSGDDGIILLDFGSGDENPILLDFGSGDEPPNPLLDFGSGSQPDIELEVARGMGAAAPYSLTACIVGQDAPPCSDADPNTPNFQRIEVRFQASTNGDIDHYQVQRKRAGFPNGTYQDVVGTATLTTNHIIDPEELPNGVDFTYRVKAHFIDAPPESGWSVPVTITAVNTPPVAVGDSGPTYTAVLNTPLNVAAPGVLSNDNDVDSPSLFKARRARLVGPGTPVEGPAGTFTGPTTSGGVIVLNSDGSFTYTPPSGLTSPPPDTFTYKADDGPWSGDLSIPLSDFSNTVTVTIQVKKKKNP